MSTEGASGGGLDVKGEMDAMRAFVQESSVTNGWANARSLADGQEFDSTGKNITITGTAPSKIEAR